MLMPEVFCQTALGSLSVFGHRPPDRGKEWLRVVARSRQPIACVLDIAEPRLHTLPWIFLVHALDVRCPIGGAHRRPVTVLAGEKNYQLDGLPSSG